MPRIPDDAEQWEDEPSGDADPCPATEADTGNDALNEIEFCDEQDDVDADDVDDAEADLARQRRREADKEVIRRLAAEGFDRAGPAWSEFQRTVLSYGYDVLKGWLMAGTIRAKAAKLHVRGLPRIPQGLRLDPDDAHELAVLLLEAAVPHFHQALRTGKWDPDGGLSLKSYFVGRCLMDLPDVSEPWQRERERWARAMVDLADLDDSRFLDDPAAVAIRSVELNEVLPPDAPDHVRIILVLRTNGHTYREIATFFQDRGIECTVNDVRLQLHKARRKARRLREKGGGDDG